MKKVKKSARRACKRDVVMIEWVRKSGRVVGEGDGSGRAEPGALRRTYGGHHPLFLEHS